MVDQHLRRSFRFMFENAGYVVGRRALGAMELARAEQQLRGREDEGLAEVLFEQDDDPDISWMDDRDLADLEAGATDILCAFLYARDDAESEPACVGSLGGIHIRCDRSGDDYLRVVAAELAAEYFS